MSIDYREQVISTILAETYDMINPDDRERFESKVILILGKYTIAEQSTEIVPYDNTNDKLLKRYIGCLRVDGKSDRTIYQYARTCRKLAEMSGKKYTEMNAYDIRMFLALEKERGISNITLENTRANLSAFFQWLTLEEETAKNPCMKIKPIKCNKEVKFPFSDVEIDSMRSSCKSLKERALIEFLLATGVRVSELSNMDIGDVNFGELKVHVRFGKGSKERITYLTPVAREHLKKYLETRNDGLPCLFLNNKKQRISSSGIQFILKEIERRTGVTNVHPHRFRRTFATNLAKRGMDVQEIKALLGHSDINTTMKYVYTDSSQIKNSYTKYSM